MRGIDIISWITGSLFGLPFEKGCTLKEKNLLPFGANSFLLEFTFFIMRLVAIRQMETGSYESCLPS